MGFLDFLKKQRDNLPDDLDSPQELLDKAKDLAESNSQMVEEVSEQIKNAIPGDKDDQVIDAAKDKLIGDEQQQSQ